MSVSIAVCFSFRFITSLRAVELNAARNQSRLQNRINPNEAPVESLVRLPGLGVGRAGAIVAYRENSMKKKGKSLAFEDCNDLLKVSGIGPKTVQNLGEWLTFD
jgi:competence ComEA-like helix-hairpin-helix protein